MIAAMNNEPKINDMFAKAKEIEIYIDGQKKVLVSPNDDFKKILTNIQNSFEESFIAPAFSVSLHKDTVDAMASGNWIKLKFDSEQSVNDLPFNALLFKLDNCYGINLIREYNGEYNGRCIYINFFNKTNLFNVLE